MYFNSVLRQRFGDFRFSLYFCTTISITLYTPNPFHQIKPYLFINFGCKDNDSLRQKMSQPQKNESKRENNGEIDIISRFYVAVGQKDSHTYLWVSVFFASLIARQLDNM